MDPQIAEEILETLVPTFESIEAQSAAVLRFLKDKQIANDEELKPYLEQAASASSVRWRAVRVRLERLLAAAEKEAEKKPAEQKTENQTSQPAKKDSEKTAAKSSPAGHDPETKKETPGKSASGERKGDEHQQHAADKNAAEPRTKNVEGPKSEDSGVRDQSQQEKGAPNSVSKPDSAEQAQSGRRKTDSKSGQSPSPSELSKKERVNQAVVNRPEISSAVKAAGRAA